MTATVQASHFNHAGLTNSPIFLGSLVNFTNGKTAKLNCMLSTT